MHDPSTSPSPTSPTPRPSRLPTPSPPPRSDARAFVHAEDVGQGLLGHRVVSGTGEDLGRVVGLVEDRDGRVRKIAFLEEDGGSPRYVPLRYIRTIHEGEIRLAGPREGYHITRVGNGGAGGLGRKMADPPDEGDDDVWTPS